MLDSLVWVYDGAFMQKCPVGSWKQRTGVWVRGLGQR